MTFEIHRILVPTDFSEPSERALEVAIELARRFGARLFLFHAYVAPSYVFPEGLEPTTPELVEQLERTMRAELELRAVRVRTAGVTAEVGTGVGPHDQEICRRARELGADLIVMGTHGRTGIRHALLGSVAEKVVRRAPCPVLTVRPDALIRPRAGPVVVR
ncbi:MAG TPA: universal stress protein [Polyangia bacterium]|jgi:nucleotide-binding universal stress UspA family protein